MPRGYYPKNQQGGLSPKDIVFNTDECIIWPLSKQASGHGYAKFNRKTVKAHRLSAFQFGILSSLDEDIQVRHKCNNPPCVNPRHLITGKAWQNTQDMLVAGNQRNQRKTHCPQGHEYSKENTLYYNSGRKCKVCNDTYYQRTKERITCQD